MIRNKTIQENLLKTVIFLANEGVTEFLSGGYGNFDILVAETVKAKFSPTILPYVFVLFQVDGTVMNRSLRDLPFNGRIKTSAR